MNEAVLPRGEFEDKEPEGPTPEEELAEVVIHLAICRDDVDAMSNLALKLHEELKSTDLGKRISKAALVLDEMKQDIKEAEAEVRTLALDIHAESAERRPHGAVLVKHYIMPAIKDEELLFNHVRVNLPQCVKLDRREVNKVAKVIALPGVEIQDEYRATIQRDLSQWLPEVEDKGEMIE